MRVLFFLFSMSSGGAERVTATLVNHWAKKEWTVTVVTIASVTQDFYVLDPRIRRIGLDLAMPSHNLAQALVNNMRRISMLCRILKRERPDIAVAMMSSANVLLALSGRIVGIPTIGSERIHPPKFSLGRLWGFFRRYTYPLHSGLVAQTEETAAWLSLHAPAKRVSVIPNPANYPLVAFPPHVTPAKVFAQLPGQRVLLAIGRLEEQKGFDQLLAAFARLVGRHPEWSLVILGDGCLRDVLIQQAIDLGILERVALPGVVGNLGDWFEVVDFYVLTSHFEGFPNALLEALSSGVPAVAVDCETGPRQILRHQVDGLLVPQDDFAALVDGLDCMMGDSSLRARFAERAVEARERFALEKIAGQWEQLFKACINRGNIEL